MKKKLYSTLLSIIMVTSSIQPALAAQNTDTNPTSTQAQTFQPKITTIDDIVNPTFISGELTKKSDASPEKIVEKYYNNDISDINIDSTNQAKNDKSFKKIKQEKTSTGKTVLKTIQTYQGVPVFGTEQSFRVSEDGVIESIIGNNIDHIEKKLANKESSIQNSQQEALNAIEKNLGFKPEYTENPEIELTLYPVHDKYVYAYKVSIDYNQPKIGGYTYYVDANDLSILQEFNHVASAEQATTGTGIGQVTSKVKNLNLVVDDSNTYYLQNAVQNFKTVNGYGIRYSEPDNNFDSGLASNFQQDAVDAHYNVTNVFNFYKQILDRDGIYDNTTSTYNVYIEENISELNAVGKPDSVHFYTRHGAAGRSLTCCLDVAGHEFTHGFLTYEGLLYSLNSENGSLHEGLSDVFGTLCEYFEPSEGSFDWIVAEDAGENFRDASNPRIDDYDDYIAEDNPESHSGAGVISKAAYLMAEGGTFNNKTVTALDSDRTTSYRKLAKIFYDVMDNDIIPTMTFSQFANAAVCAADELYGMNVAGYVLDAFEAVGILFYAAPTNFAETGTRNGLDVTFSWDGNSGETYAIYRSNGTQLVKFNNTTSNTATVQTLDGTCYFYVAQVDASGNRVSAYSNALTIETYPAAPQNFRMTNRVGNTITFSWDPTVRGYYLVCGEVNGEIVYLQDSTNTTATLSVNPGTVKFYVHETDDFFAKCSLDSNALTIETAAAPKNFSLTQRSGLDCGFSWTATPGANYAIYRKATGSTDAPVQVTTSSTNNVNVSAPTLLGSYDFYVAQIDSDGYRMSDFSSLVTVVTN